MQMTNTFLPTGYVLTQGASDYVKLKQGKNKIRIVSNSIVGWIDWKDNQPVRTKTQQPAINADRKPREFRAFAVRDYSDDKVKSMEVTQASIKQAIYALYNNEDRGDIKDYDLTIERTGEGMETKYTVTPSPKKELTKDQKDTIEETSIDMEVLFDGGHPIQKLEKVISDSEDNMPF